MLCFMISHATLILKFGESTIIINSLFIFGLSVSIIIKLNVMIKVAYDNISRSGKLFYCEGKKF